MKLNINCDLPDNCTLDISDKGIVMKVSLNVPKNTTHHFKDVWKGRRNVIFTSKQLCLSDLTYDRMWYHYKTLINILKVQARKAKVKVLKEEINTIQTKIIF